MYGMTGDFTNKYFNYADPNNRDLVVQLCPPARPYIKKSFEGILMYDCNYADPTNNSRVRVVEIFIYKTS